MANSNPLKVSPTNAPKKTATKAIAKTGVFKPIAKALILITISVILLVTFAVFWLTSTDVGTKYSLVLLGQRAGIQTQGISGNLINQIKIQRIEFHTKEMDLVADDVEFQWQPKALLDHQLRLDYVRINNLQLAIAPGNDKPLKLPESLTLPPSLKLVKADQLSVNNFQLATLDANRNHHSPQQFSALKASALINSTAYQLQFAGTTPWGSATLNGGFDSASPFRTEAKIEWRGLALEQSGVTLPVTQLHGELSGNLNKLLVHAQLNVAPDSQAVIDGRDKKIARQEMRDMQRNEPASGQLYAVLTPFSILPIESLQLDVSSANPSIFYAGAPKANLQIKANFKATGDIKSPVLNGQISTKNSHPMAWNAGGIPIANLSSELILDAHQLVWKSTKIEFGDGGSAMGSGHLALDKVASLPDITTVVEVKNVNLLHLDSRLKKTQLNGTIQVDSVKTGLQFGLHLQDVQPNLQAKLTGDIQLSHEQVLNFQKVELLSKDATFSARGSFALRDKQEFSLQGEARNFNPARWINVPEGRIASHFNVKGQVQQGWRVDAQVSGLSGQFAGLNLHGESDVVAQQDKLLSIKKLELTWGQSHLTAKGNWQIGEMSNAHQQNQLQLTLAVPDLGALSRPFEKIIPVKMNGSVFADGVLSGNARQPSGHFNMNANNVSIPDVVAFEKMQATVALADGTQGKMGGNVNVIGFVAGASKSKGKETGGFKIDRIQANLEGLRHAHQLHVTAALPRKYQIELQAQGDLQQAASNMGHVAQWRGAVQQFNLTGPLDMQLTSPFGLQISSQAIQMGEAHWQGKLGKLQIQQINWSHGQLKTKGQLIGLPVLGALKLARANVPLIGNLQIDAGWQLDIGQQIAGQFEIKRTSGDITIQDVSGGHSQTFALGLQNLLINGSIGRSGENESRTVALHQPISIQLQAQGSQLGQIDANVHSSFGKTAQGWAIGDSTPVSGIAKMQINDIQWMSQFLGSGMALHGELKAQAQLAGTVEKPDYSVKISGKELDVSLTDLGVLLPHGILEASIEAGSGSTQLKLSNLTFSQTIKAPPKNDKLTGLTWLGETGYVTSSGTIDLQSGRGSIATHWERFPFLQNADSWLVASGNAQLTELEKGWNLTGQLLADAAYFSVPKQAPPKLSSDVIVLKKNDKRELDKTEGVQSNVDFIIKTGSNFVFVGRGLNTNLNGDLRIRIENDGPVFASGSIQTAGGTYDGYGQKLSIERGILNFQGAVDNPGLNVRALRRGLPVEAGVEVIGTVSKPEVRLISEPNVPDQDKLSWLVLGRSSDQVGGSDASLLISAASAILGGDNGSSIPKNIAQTFGLDELSVSSAASSPESQLPSQTVAGNISNNMTSDQVFSVGKRITPDLVVSVERSLTDATNGLKLTWKLTRRFSIIGRAGSDNSIDGQYIFSFN